MGVGRQSFLQLDFEAGKFENKKENAKLARLTELGSLLIGYRDKDGTWHKDYEMRAPTMADMDEAISQAGEDASEAKIQRYVWARTITCIGALTNITPEMLGALADIEYGQLIKTERDLKKNYCTRATAQKQTPP